LNSGEKADLNVSIKSPVRGLYTATLTLFGDCGEVVYLPVKVNIDCQTTIQDTINFGYVFLNSMKTLDISCLVENHNGIDLVINPLIQGKNPADFGLIKLQSDTVFSKQCFITQLTFTPKLLGQRLGRINLSMKDPCGEQIIYLIGIGINPSAVLPEEIDGVSAEQIKIMKVLSQFRIQLPINVSAKYLFSNLLQ